MATTFMGESPTDRYYLQDARTFCGNDVLWWRPDGNGYTTDLDSAGIYPRTEVQGYRESDHAWPVETILPLANRVVDMQKLRGKEPA